MSEEITMDEAEDRFEAALNELNPIVTIGQLEYEPGRVLRQIDPIAFREGVHEFAHAYELEIV